MSDTVVITVPERRRYQWWRDVVILILAITVGSLVVLILRGQGDVRELRAALDRQDAAATTERAELSAQVVALAEVARASEARIRIGDAEIKRLTDIIIAAGLEPGTSLVDTNQDGDVDLGSSTAPSDPSPTPAPQPGPAASSTPAPAPTRTSGPNAPPSPRPTPVPLLCDVPLPLTLPGCPGRATRQTGR